MTANITIIMRTKNRPILLRRAIFSVIQQVYSDWRLIIINDGGDPDAVDRHLKDVEAAQKYKITVIHNGRQL